MLGKTFTLRSWFVVLTIFLLFMGWAADHFYFQRDARVLMLTKQLQREIDNANAAQTWEEYENAVRTGVYIIWEISEHREKSAIAMPAYAAAMRAPRKYDIDYSLSAEAEVGLAAIGKDAIPFIIGLMSDEDPQVRESAERAASLMISQERTHILNLSLPPEDAKKVEQRINDLGLR